MVNENVFRIRQRVIEISSKIKQDPEKIAVIAVSKGRSIEQIKEAINAGITDIGENRIQEALVKYNELMACDLGLKTIRWHMVGHLQTNKVKDAVKIFDLIQSVDSLRLAEEIDKQAHKINKIQDILMEIKTSPEENKTGLKPDEAIKVIAELTKLKNINIKGLMTIAPIADNPEKTRPYFRMLRELRDKINMLTTNDYQLTTLSMGMTDDFEIAIDEGSNMVRLGRAIFE